MYFSKRLQHLNEAKNPVGVAVAAAPDIVSRNVKDTLHKGQQAAYHISKDPVRSIGRGIKGAITAGPKALKRFTKKGKLNKLGAATGAARIAANPAGAAAGAAYSAISQGPSVSETLPTDDMYIGGKKPLKSKSTKIKLPPPAFPQNESLYFSKVIKEAVAKLNK